MHNVKFSNIILRDGTEHIPRAYFHVGRKPFGGRTLGETNVKAIQLGRGRESTAQVYEPDTAYRSERDKGTWMNGQKSSRSACCNIRNLSCGGRPGDCRMNEELEGIFPKVVLAI